MVKHAIFDLDTAPPPVIPTAPSRAFYTTTGKRLLDLGLALILAPILLPVIAGLWISARLDGGPGFFLHKRIGRSGRGFWCIKIRTMRPDAHLLLTDYLAENPDAAREWARDAKLRNDPRVTRLGAVLRRASLDELPQIFNVLRGEMSFVGPRPVPADELARYGDQRSAYVSVRPGITGAWQVSGRNDISYAARISLDRAYSAQISFLGDLRILALTVGEVLRRSGL